MFDILAGNEAAIQSAKVLSHHLIKTLIKVDYSNWHSYNVGCAHIHCNVTGIAGDFISPPASQDQDYP